MRRRWVGIGLLVALAAGCSAGSDDRPEVLGTQVTRAPDPTTTTAAPAPEATTTTSAPAAAPTTTPATTTTAVPAPPPPAPPTSAGPPDPFAPGAYDERSDSTAGLERTPDGSWAATSSTQEQNPPPAERLAFDVSLGLPSGGAAAVTVALRNSSPRAMSFPEGLRVLVRCTEDGGPWQDVVVQDPSVTGLQAGQSVVRSGSMGVGEGRTYACAGETRVVLV